MNLKIYIQNLLFRNRKNNKLTKSIIIIQYIMSYIIRILTETATYIVGLMGGY